MPVPELELKKFETTMTPFGIATIEYIEKTIRQNCAKTGTVVDAGLDQRIKAAAARAHAVSADRTLDNLSTTPTCFSADVIESSEMTIRQHYARAGIVVDAGLDERIKATTARLHAASAQKDLADFAATTIPFRAAVIEYIASTIRQQYARAGIAVDAELDERIEAATTRARALSDRHAALDEPTCKSTPKPQRSVFRGRRSSLRRLSRS